VNGAARQPGVLSKLEAIFGGQRRARLWAGAVVAVLICAIGAVAIMNHLTEARLLRADPNTVPASPALMGFALARGSPVFRAHCAVCHGAEGRGDPSRGVPDLTDNDWLYGTGQVSDIEQVVDYGIRSHNPKAWNLAEMPAFAHAVPSATEKMGPLSPGDIRDVVEFLRSTQGLTSDTAAVARGSQIYQGRGGCFDCHASDARGDSAIGAPNLTDKVWLYGDGSRQAVFDSIAHGHRGVCPAWITQLRPGPIREAALYVYSLSHRGPAAASKAS
jgi:cytochrome c oxidase cbb3-type subunit 3